MSKANGYSCLQVWVDTFTGWIEVFPCRSEQAKEVIKILFYLFYFKLAFIGV